MSKNTIQAYMMIAVPLFGVVIFTILPFLWIVGISFLSCDGFDDCTFAGLSQFAKVFSQSPEFWQAVLNSALYTFCKLIIEIPLAFLLAFILSWKFIGRGFFRFVYLMPYILSVSVVGIIFNFMFSHQFGPVNLFLHKIGLNGILWFSSRPTALATAMIASVWQNFGLNMIYLTIGLAGISDSLYESAVLDGAGFWRQLFCITLPNMKKVFLVVVLNAILGSLRETDLFLTLTNGSPAGRSEVMMTYVYKRFFAETSNYQDFGYLSAFSVIGSVILATFAIVAFKAGRNEQKT